jgi:uridine phosphorylase
MPDTTPSTRLPILGVAADRVAPRALVVGDPARVPETAAHLDDAHELGRSREYVTWAGWFEGVEVTVASHGVGSAGAAICFEELARAGVTRVVRAGTCGGLQETVVDGDLVVGTAAVRDEGLTDRFVPAGWPAVADPRLTLALAGEARATGLRTHVGVVHTAANFYPALHEAEPRWRRYHRAGALAIEMELAALLVVAQLHGIAAGGILAVDGNLLAAAADMSDYAPEREVVSRAKQAMLVAALRVLVAA